MLHARKTGLLVRTFVLAAVLAALHGVAPVAAHAQQGVAEPDAFARGTDLSHAFPGVVLSTVHVDGSADIVTATAAYGREASTGTLVFGDSSRSPYFSFSGPGAGYLLRADFAAPTGSVSLDFINNDFGYGTDVGRLEAYNSAGDLVASAATNVLANDGDFQTLSVSSPAASIAYVLAGGDYLTGDDVNLDHLMFGTAAPAAAPEPSPVLAVGLGGLGLIALALRARRASQTV